MHVCARVPAGILFSRDKGFESYPPYAIPHECLCLSTHHIHTHYRTPANKQLSSELEEAEREWVLVEARIAVGEALVRELRAAAAEKR